MQAKLVLLLVALTIGSLRAQEATLIGPQFDYTYTGEAFHSAGGINVEGMFGKRLSVNYAALYGPIGPKQYYFYTGGGQALGVYLIKKSIEDRNGLALAIPLGIFSFILPESFAYRIPLSNDSQLGFFLAPYGYELINNELTEEREERTSYELGLRYYLAAGNWLYIIPRVGMKGFYGERPLGGSVGVSFMIRVNKD